jgi:hypothetical protein
MLRSIIDDALAESRATARPHGQIDRFYGASGTCA